MRLRENTSIMIIHAALLSQTLKELRCGYRLTPKRRRAWNIQCLKRMGLNWLQLTTVVLRELGGDHLIKNNFKMNYTKQLLETIIRLCKISIFPHIMCLKRCDLMSGNLLKLIVIGVIKIYYKRLGNYVNRFCVKQILAGQLISNMTQWLQTNEREF